MHSKNNVTAFLEVVNMNAPTVALSLFVVLFAAETVFGECYSFMFVRVVR